MLYIQKEIEPEKTIKLLYNSNSKITITVLYIVKIRNNG